MMDHRLEEVLETLYLRLEDQSRLDIGTPGGEGLRLAVEQGYVDDVTQQLTETGRPLGELVVRRHRLAECLLRDVLRVFDAEAEEDACRFEHILRPGLEDRVCTLLGHPTTCPHGRVIPRGDCCRRAERDGVNEVAALCDGRAGQTGVVAYLSTRDNREIQKLMAMGILPGSDIRLMRLFPSYIFEIGHSQFTVDRALAEKIIVHWR